MFSWIHAFISRTRTWLSPSLAEGDFAAELESHLEMLTEENLQKGMPAEQARRQARNILAVAEISLAMVLLLAATGIFGVISYSVSCRTNEIGIRAALGASRGAILRLILRETMLLALAGLALGFPCALIVSHLIAHLLFGVSANDPATLVAVAIILSAVAALAGFIPARRAMQVNPTVALRHE